MVFLLCSSPSQGDSTRTLKITGYSEIVLDLELKTPFKKGKKISLYAHDSLKTYTNIYFLDQYQESSQGFDLSEQSKVIIYVPNQYISELAQTSKLTAIPYQSKMKTRKKIAVHKETYEIIY